jgi:hypothetical protein
MRHIYVRRLAWGMGLVLVVAAGLFAWARGG